MYIVKHSIHTHYALNYKIKMSLAAFKNRKCISPTNIILCKNKNDTKKMLQLHVSRKKLILIPKIMLSVNTGTHCIHFQYDNSLIVNT